MEENITVGQVAKKYGMLYALVGVLVSLVPMILEIQSQWLIVLGPITAVVIYIIADKEFRTANGGFMSFGEGFKLNMIAATIAGVIRAAVTYGYIKFLDPDFAERTQQTMIETWQAQGMSEEQIEQNLRFAGGFSSPEVAAVMGVVMAILGALILGSIVAAVIKNENEDSY